MSRNTCKHNNFLGFDAIKEGEFDNDLIVTTTTQPQMSLRYDTTNKTDFSVSSSGGLTITPSGGDMAIGAILNVTDNTNATNYLTGSIHTPGGISCGKDLVVGHFPSGGGTVTQKIQFGDANAATGYNIGSIRASVTPGDDNSSFTIYNRDGMTGNQVLCLTIGSVSGNPDNENYVVAEGTTAAASSVTGNSLQTKGGLGVTSSAYFGGALRTDGNLTVNGQANFTSTTGSEQLQLSYNGANYTNLGTNSSGSFYIDPVNSYNVHIGPISGGNQLDCSLSLGESAVYGDFIIKRVQSTTDYGSLGFDTHVSNLEEAIKISRTGEVSLGNATPLSGTALVVKGIQVNYAQTTNSYTNFSTSSSDGDFYISTVPSGGGGGSIGFIASNNQVHISAPGGSGTLYNNNSQILTTRQTGYTTITGTQERGGWDTSTVTLETLARTVFGLITDLSTHGLIGPSV